MICYLGTWRGDPKIVYKNVSFDSGHDCKVVDTFDVIGPTLIMDGLIQDANYAKIYDRNYYIIDRQFINNDRTVLKLTEDVLSTWYDKCTIEGTIIKSSENYNADLKQDLPLQVNTKIRRIMFDDNKEQIEGATIIMQTPLPVYVKPD